MQQNRALAQDEQNSDLQKAIREMENVFSTRGRSLYRSAYRFLGNVADAEDAVQDAILSAYKHLRDFRGESQMSTWLTAIVGNSARMRLRGRSVRQHLSLDERIGEEKQYSVSEQLTYAGPSPEDAFRNSEFSTRVGELLVYLSPCLRKAFELRDVSGHTTSDAARILGVTEGTLKAQLSRARIKLRPLVAQILETPTSKSRHEVRPG